MSPSHLKVAAFASSPIHTRIGLGIEAPLTNTASHKERESSFLRGTLEVPRLVRSKGMIKRRESWCVCPLDRCSSERLRETLSGRARLMVNVERENRLLKPKVAIACDRHLRRSANATFTIFNFSRVSLTFDFRLYSGEDQWPARGCFSAPAAEKRLEFRLAGSESRITAVSPHRLVGN